MFPSTKTTSSYKESSFSSITFYCSFIPYSVADCVAVAQLE